jgi:hypothetical protein
LTQNSSIHRRTMADEMKEKIEKPSPDSDAAVGAVFLS